MVQILNEIFHSKVLMKVSNMKRDGDGKNYMKNFLTYTFLLVFSE